ncbi:hypothetical protein DIE18_03385 [Burkholderia sp. Bp9125]|nr:hypothetical protein DIE18_03385 [Burkholderia sp. Bp9125]
MVVAVGLLIGAALMVACGQPFFRWWLADNSLHSWILALSLMSPAQAQAAGLQLVGALTFATLCVGAGLLISVILSGIIEVMGLALGGMVAVAAVVSVELGRRAMRRVHRARLSRSARRTT